MTPRELPARPNLEQLKKQAKSLFHDAQAHDGEALRRFAALPAFSGKTITEIDPADLALHDAQSVIAREYGFPSWPALREEVEARTLSFDEAVDEFLRCATGDARGRAERLLALHPKIASANFYTALVLGDAASVDPRLRDQPALATQPGGPQNWEPLLYVCHSCMKGTEPSRASRASGASGPSGPPGKDGFVAIAQQLCKLGANPNTEYHWNWHPELPRTALWGAICAVEHLPLAEVLLKAGANPTDGVSAHIAGGGGNIDALELLHRYGLNADGIPGGVPPLVYMMLWSDNPAGSIWFLEHGANPNLAWGEDGEAPLHVAARRWNLALVERLVRHGADVSRRRGDGATAHTLAELNGNAEIAAWLLAHGAQDELSPVDRFAAACARGDRAAAESMLAAHPGLQADLRPDHHLMLHRAAESGNVPALETMLACGFDPEAKDKDSVRPLHRAAMSGHPEAVRVLLQHHADVNATDGMFAASPLIWAVEGRRHARPGSDHVEVARLLIAANCPLGWTPPEGAPSAEGTLEGLADLRRATERVS